MANRSARVRNSLGGEEIYLGRARNQYYQNGLNGIALPHIMTDVLGAITASATASVSVLQTTAGAADLTITGALASGGVATMFCGRVVSLTSAGNISAVTFTIYGTDDLSRPIRQNVTGPNANTVFSTVCFKTVTRVAASAAVGSNTSVGHGNVFNFKFRLPANGNVIACSQDGKPESTLTLVAGQSATFAATSTSTDQRGTWAPNTAPDGTKQFSATYSVDRTYDETAFGTAPFNG